MFAISMLARQVHDPCMRHNLLAKRVLSYVKVHKVFACFFLVTIKREWRRFMMQIVLIVVR